MNNEKIDVFGVLSRREILLDFDSGPVRRWIGVLCRQFAFELAVLDLELSEISLDLVELDQKVVFLIVGFF